MNREPDCTSDEFEAMLQGRAWALFEYRMLAALEDKRKELEGPLDQNQTNIARGWCQALRRAVEVIPQGIMDELQAKER